jgi:hypothetical protein
MIMPPPFACGQEVLAKHRRNAGVICRFSLAVKIYRPRRNIMIAAPRHRKAHAQAIQLPAEVSFRIEGLVHSPNLECARVRDLAVERQALVYHVDH